MDLIPLFKSHYSIGRSVLTFRSLDSSKENEPDSIVDIAHSAGMKRAFVVEDTMSGLLEGYSNLKEAKIGLHFGIRITVCNDIKEKNAESVENSCKCVIFAKDTQGYRKLIKLYSIAAKEGFYYEPRIDYENIKSNWDNKHLSLCVPFYDSFLFKNLLTTSVCIPDTNSIPLTFFIEDNDLPFDHLVKSKVEQYAGDRHETINTKSVYYKNKKDFKDYLTFKCIGKRTTLDKPNMDHMCSDEFCFESWNEKVQNN